LFNRRRKCPVYIEEQSNVNEDFSMLDERIRKSQDKDIPAGTGTHAFGTQTICKKECHSFVSKKEGNINAKALMLGEPIAIGRFASPPEYKVLNIPGDGSCGFWAVGTAKTAKEVT
jgi:hypothetical protein